MTTARPDGGDDMAEAEASAFLSSILIDNYLDIRR
jgi:hypothetical protein